MIFWKTISNWKRKAVLLEELEIQKAINHFTQSLMSEDSLERIFKVISQNCISRLGAECCVIYTPDKDKDCLVTTIRAGTNASMDKIPTLIPFGKGIAGCVALKEMSELIPDSVKDERYCEELDRRCSRVLIPVILKEDMLALIDVQHPVSQYYRRRHLRILNTVASVAAKKMERLN